LSGQIPFKQIAQAQIVVNHQDSGIHGSMLPLHAGDLFPNVSECHIGHKGLHKTRYQTNAVYMAGP
jgi:hypothetical protein